MAQSGRKERQDMEDGKIRQIGRTLAYIEDHLEEPLDLNRVSGQSGYSKYHLHRMFSQATGFGIHAYIQRRRLTRAAWHLVYGERPVMDIALEAGYAGRQAFTQAFQAMYKRPPAAYRREGRYYPLLLDGREALEAWEHWDKTELPGIWRETGGRKRHEKAASVRREAEQGTIVPAEPSDLPDLVQLARARVDGFPGWEEKEFRSSMRTALREGRVWRISAGGQLCGAVSVSEQPGTIAFLGVRPPFSIAGTGKALVDFLEQEIYPGTSLSLTTFRRGDRADAGWRAVWVRLGFAEAELLEEYGYPTQRFVRESERRRP